MNSPTAKPPLPMRVIEFLRANPEESLTAMDVAAKFDASRKNVHTLLARAVENGMLIRSRDDDGDYIYTPGPAIHTHATNREASAAVAASGRKAQQLPGLNMDAIYSARLDARVEVDWRTVAIDVDGPPPPIKRGRTVAEYTALLDRLSKPGQSFAVPSNALGIHGLRKVISDRHKTTKLRYQYAEQGGMTRFWRLA